MSRGDAFQAAFESHAAADRLASQLMRMTMTGGGRELGSSDQHGRVLSASGSRSRLLSGSGSIPFGRRAGSASSASSSSLSSNTSVAPPAQQTRGTLARDGILPRPRRTPSHSHGESVDLTTAAAVPAHTLAAVPASRQIQGHSRTVAPLASGARLRRSTAPLDDGFVVREKRVPTGQVGGGWVRTGEGAGRARWDESHKEIKLEGTSSSLFVALHDAGREAGIAATHEWQATCEIKCTGATYLLLYCQCERDSAHSDSTSSLGGASAPAHNSPTLSFLAICTWSLEVKRPGGAPSIILGTVRDETLSANRFYHCRVEVTRGRLTLAVDGHTFFSRIHLACLDPSAPGGMFAVGVVRSKVHVKGFQVKERIEGEERPGNVAATCAKPLVRPSPPYSASSVAYANGQPIAPMSSAGVSERTAAIFGSVQPTAAPASVERGSGRLRPTSGTSTGEGYSHHPDGDDGEEERYGGGPYNPTVYQPAPYSQPPTAPPASAGVSRDRFHPASPPPAGPHVSPSDARAPRPAYSSALHGDDPRMIELIESSIINRDLGVGLDDIASLDEAKQLLREAVILPLILPEFFSGIRQPTRGLLLHGPPGTGQTARGGGWVETEGRQRAERRFDFVAHWSDDSLAIANVAEVVFFNVSAATLTSKWRGESEKLVQCLFRMARYYAPAIVFLDEIDALMTTRGGASEHEASRAFKAVMFSQIDGLMSAPTSSPAVGASGEAAASQLVMLLATTNCPWALDQAIRRRLEKRIYIPLPDAKARGDMLRLHLRDITLSPDVDFLSLASRTDGFSGADLKILARDAAMAPFRRLVAGKTPNQIRELKDTPGALAFRITMQDCLDALQRVQPSVSKQDVVKFEEWQAEFGSGM